MAVTPCPTCVVQTAGGTRKGKRKRTRPSRGRSSSSSSRDSRAPSQRRTRGRRAPSTPRHVGYLRRRAMALAKTLERNPSAKARQSFVTQMRNKFPDAPIRKKDSPTVAIEKALDAQEAADEEPARARKPTKRARNGRRSSSTKRAVAAVKKRARRHMRRVLLGIVALLGAVGVGVAVRGKVKELEEAKKNVAAANKIKIWRLKKHTKDATDAEQEAKQEARAAKQEARAAKQEAKAATQKLKSNKIVIHEGELLLRNRYGKLFHWDKRFCKLYHDKTFVIYTVPQTTIKSYKIKYIDKSISKYRFNIQTETNLYDIKLKANNNADYQKWYDAFDEVEKLV